MSSAPPTAAADVSRSPPTNHTANTSRTAPRPAAQTSSSSARRTADDSTQDEQFEEFELKYGAEHVIRLFVPVSLCMLVVIVTINTVTYYSRDDGTYLYYTPFTSKTDSSAVLALQSIGNALIMLAVVIVMTVVLIVLYKYKFYKVIAGWLILSSVIMLTMFSIMYLYEVLGQWNVAADYISIAFSMWNWGVVGMIAIHWKAPLRLQQVYLVCISALMALIFIKFLPEWTTWTVLGIIAIWDLVAVLCPIGPLRILVETAQERNEPIFPALIYSSGVAYTYTMIGMADTNMGLTNQNIMQSASTNQRTEQSSATPPSDTGSGSGANDTQPSTSTSTTNTPDSNRRLVNRKKQVKVISADQVMVTTEEDRNAGFDETWQQRRAAQEHSSHDRAARSLNGNGQNTNAENTTNSHMDNTQEDDEESGVKLGLGDFIFYSVLVGKASSYGDWNTTIACYVSILIGLCLTLILLAVRRKALPALPISIAFGLVFYFGTSYILSPFVTALSYKQIML